MQIRTLCTFLLLLLSAGMLHAQFGSSSVRVNADPGTAKQASPQIRVDRNGTIYIVWTDERSNGEGDIYLRRSTDGGKTFLPEQPVYTGGKSPSSMQRGAQLAIDSLGGIHVVWTEWQGNDPQHIYYTRSIDNGNTFSKAVVLTPEPLKATQDFPTLAIDRDNRIYLAFVDNREQVGKPTGYSQLLVKRSTDRGATFDEPKKASLMPGGKGGSCECCNTSTAVTPDGHLYISFRSDISNRRDIFIARSFDRGETFQTAVAAPSEEWKIPACPMTGSSILLDREETAHVVWRDSRPSANGKARIYYTSLRRSDTAAAPDLLLSDAMANSNFPSITMTPQGAIVTAFQDSRDDAMDVRYSVSNDGGNTFTPGTKLSDETGESRQEEVILAIGGNGERYAVWQDSRRDAGDIMFSRDDSPIAVTLPVSPAMVVPGAGATVGTSVTFRWNPPANLGNARNANYTVSYAAGGDTTYVMMIRGMTYRTTLPPGEYTWSVRAHTLIGNSPINPMTPFTVSGTSDVAPWMPPVLELMQNMPNPVRSGIPSMISFTMPDRDEAQTPLRSATRAVLTIHNAIGEVISVPFDRDVQPGSFNRVDVPEELTGGLYYYSLRTLGRTIVRKMVVVD